MRTATVLIGNTDNKLTQQEWSRFYADTSNIVDGCAGSAQFSGASSGEKPWQNACWVFTIAPSVPINDLREYLRDVATRYRQDSIALVVGETEFVKQERPAPKD